MRAGRGRRDALHQVAAGEGLAPLPLVLIEPVVRAALLEDLGLAGDITSDVVVPKGARARVQIAARKAGRIAGLDVAATAFRLLDPAVEVRVLKCDGSDVAAGGVVATVAGDARAILTAERVALNFVCHLSGVATAAAEATEATTS